MKNKKPVQVAYFSMEFAFSDAIPNYAGGLGVLAADTIYSSADLGINAVGVSLLYHKDDDQSRAFQGGGFMKRCPEKIWVQIENRQVEVAIWKMDIKGGAGRLPVYFLSTYLPENQPWDRDITKNLYAQDGYTRLCQEAILGIGGVRALEALGYGDIKCYHMNEGHCSFLTLELLRKKAYDENKVRSLCSFTTHTPLPSGHDRFDYDLAYRVIGEMLPWNIRELAGKERLGMTELGLNLSARASAVSKKHLEVCQKMFPGRKIISVTNGIYHPRWVGKHLSRLFDKYLKNWKQNPDVFSYASKRVPTKLLVESCKLQKKELIRWINSNSQFIPLGNLTREDRLLENVLTIGFARRFVPYKRPDLIFEYLEMLKKIGSKKLQLVFAGHCDPTHEYCNDIMKNIGYFARKLRGEIKVVLVPDYNLEISRRLVAGCDIWLNTPIPPQEASGTSGMKAALNGCPNLSILDGWWVEGFKMDPKSGWSFGGKIVKDRLQDEVDAKDLYRKLEDAIDCYYNRKNEWAERMKNSISLASYFNTHRSTREYLEKLWNGNA